MLESDEVAPDIILTTGALWPCYNMWTYNGPNQPNDDDGMLLVWWQ